MRGAEVENVHRLAGVKRQNKGARECFRGPILCIIESSFSSAVGSMKNETKKKRGSLLRGEFEAPRARLKETVSIFLFYFGNNYAFFFPPAPDSLRWWGKPDATFHQIRWNSEADVSNGSARPCVGGRRARARSRASLEQDAFMRSKTGRGRSAPTVQEGPGRGRG